MTISLTDALTQLKRDALQPFAGGTDYYPATGELGKHRSLLDVRDVEGLDRIEKVEGFWRIGAGVTWSKLVDTTLPPCFHGLKQAAREIGSIQIQNNATLVGNLCNASPAADGVPALLVLDAQLELSSASGSRFVHLSDFIIGVRETVLQRGELVTAVLVPDTLDSHDTEFTKLGSRTYLVISIVMCSSRLQTGSNGIISDAAIAVGACSPVALRLTDIERNLVGKHYAEVNVPEIVTLNRLTALTPITDVRATADYRLHAASVLIKRQLSVLLKRAGGAQS